MGGVVAVDIGGTFTDLVAYDHEAGEVKYTKAPTSYHDFAEGVFECFGKADVDAASVALVNHGTTLVINALIQRKGARSALVTTRGFRDILEIARGNRPDPFDIGYRRSAPLIPRTMRLEVTERMNARGEIVTPLDLDELKDLAKRIANEKIEAVAVFFMNSYANDAHEAKAAQILRDALPGVYVTASTELTREWYEYERTSTAAANAYVGPPVSSYLRKLEGDLIERKFKGSLFMMGSNGGLLSVDRACRQPIALVESGPIGGCIGAAAFAEALGLPNVIAFDMGGTTAKCALVDNGRFSVESTYYVDGYVKGFPIKSPVVEIVEVGAGGGSIAWLDPQNRLRVGPNSAGSTPGPVCYGRGGREPTVTDANLVLGRLNPEKFLGGELHLDKRAARAALDLVAAPIGYNSADGVERLADGILSISTAVMAGAVKQVSTEHGLDPRDFALFCYGGGGPLHASALARELSIPTVIIPPEPGNFSAIGMLLADARIDSSKTFVGHLDPECVRSVDEVFAALEKDAREALEREFGAHEAFFERRVEMRYVGQRHNIKILIDASAGIDDIRRTFDRDYERRYGHADPLAPAEFQAVHLSAYSRRPRPDLRGLSRKSASRAVEPRTRAVWFGAVDGFVDAKVFERSSLPIGFKAEGPALIEEYGSTTLVAPGDRFEIGALGEIRIDVDAVGATAAAHRSADREDVDPITFEVIRYGVVSIANQIDANIKRTAFSPYIYEYNDFAVGMTDANGLLTAQCVGGMPPFVADSVGMAVRDGLQTFGQSGFHYGDVVLCNHAAVQGQHLNNTVMYTPIFVGRDKTELVGFFAINVHWIDIGGSAPLSTDIFMEGLQLRSIKLWSKGVRNDDVYRIIENNTRLPEELLGDIAAQLAGCLLGRDLTARLVERYGLNIFKKAVTMILDKSEAAARAFIRSLPDGSYSHETFLDNDRSGNTPLRIKATVIVSGDAFTVDYSEMAEQANGPINSGWFGGGQTTARVAFKYLLGDEMANEGMFRPVKLILPEGKLLSAAPTAPMGNYSTPFPTVIDCVIKALEKALPDRVPGGHFATHSGVRFYGRRTDGSFFDSHDSGHGGWGACATHDGSGPFRTMAHGDTRIIPLELQESWLPFLIEELSLRQDSGGAGKYRGGLGFKKVYRILADCQLQTNLDRTKFPPWGVQGGKQALPGKFSLVRADTGETIEMGKSKGIALRPGDLLIVETGGGGGYGPPEERSLEMVQADVEAGYVSILAAQADYGVVVQTNGRVARGRR